MFKRIFSISILLVFIAGLAIAAGPAPAAPASRDGELREAVEKYIQQKTANLGWDVRIKRLTLSGNTSLPTGPLDFEVVAPQQWEGWGMVNLAVIVRQGDRIVRNTSMRAEVEALADMVVTLRQLDHGTILTNSDMAVQKRDIASVGGKFSRSIEDFLGKRARTTIKANAAIKLDQVEKVPLITSGQMVNIIAENEVIKVSVAGKAKSAGAEGDMIVVQNLNSLKDIPARVINSTTVQVNF